MASMHDLCYILLQTIAANDEQMRGHKGFFESLSRKVEGALKKHEGTKDSRD